MAKRVNEYKRQSMTSRDGDKLIKQYNSLKQSFEKQNEDINVKKREFTPIERMIFITYHLSFIICFQNMI